jgi:hypothetical protein
MNIITCSRFAQCAFTATDVRCVSPSVGDAHEMGLTDTGDFTTNDLGTRGVTDDGEVVLPAVAGADGVVVAELSAVLTVGVDGAASLMAEYHPVPRKLRMRPLTDAVVAWKPPNSIQPVSNNRNGQQQD